MGRGWQEGGREERIPDVFIRRSEASETRGGRISEEEEREGDHILLLLTIVAFN